MPTLNSGLETVAEGTQGANSVYTSNMELIDQKVEHIFNASVIPGTQAQADSAETPTSPAAVTSQSLTDSTTGTGSTTINDVGATFNQNDLNDNFASLAEENNKKNADIVELRTKLDSLTTAFLNLQTEHNNLLAKFRITGGIGILND